MANVFKHSCNRQGFSRRGFSLTELTIVIGIIATLLGGIWSAVNFGWDYYRREQAVEEITTVVNNIRAAYAGQAGLPGEATGTLTSGIIQTGIIPIFMRRMSGVCTNPGGFCADAPWGPYIPSGIIDPAGTFRICAWYFGAATSGKGAIDCPTAGFPSVVNMFAVVVRGLPAASCIDIANRISGAAGPTGLLEAAIDQNNIGPTGLGNPIQPIKPSDATTWCSSMDSNGNEVRFVYQLTAPPP